MGTNAEIAGTVHTTDFFKWSQSQARLLKSLRLVCQDIPIELDIENIAEEIEDLGRAELNAVESQIQNIFVHLLKAISSPNAPSVPHWRTETTTFYAELVRKYSPSMDQRINLQKAWRLAMRIAQDSLREHDGKLVAGLPEVCPFVIDDLVSDDFHFDQATDWLATFVTAPPSPV